MVEDTLDEAYRQYRGEPFGVNEDDYLQNSEKPAMNLNGRNGSQSKARILMKKIIIFKRLNASELP